MIIVIKKLIALLAILILTLSCNSKPSLQKYLVDNQTREHFRVVDIPANIVDYNSLNLSDNQIKAYETIDKLNCLMFRKTENNASLFKSELSEVRQLLSDQKYKKLSSYKSKKNKIEIKHTVSIYSLDLEFWMG